MFTGQVKKKIDDRYFGFIATESGNDIFFHGSAVNGTTWEDLSVGANVQYEVEDTPKGKRAINVTIV